MRDTSHESIAATLIEEAKEVSIAAGLVYVSDTEPGITRVRRGKRFEYFDSSGKRIRKVSELQRIASLAIPPAYSQVWICNNVRGHLQATGRDARGRKQYRYHAKWREKRDGTKFDRMHEFGLALPRLRRQLKKDLALPGLPREKVLAVIATLLDSKLVRIGNAEYARSNRSFGLTTLRDRHVTFLREGRAVFRFRGKGGVQHEVKIDDVKLATIVHRCQELPGQQLFQFVDDDGLQHGVDSTVVNDYLRRVMGQDFTAKDFRTWNATLRAIELLRATPLPEKKTARALKECIVCVVREVAAELRNTPAVCRKSYINPVVFPAWQDGRLHRLLGKAANRKTPPATPANRDKLALLFLKRLGRN